MKIQRVLAAVGIGILMAGVTVSAASARAVTDDPGEGSHGQYTLANGHTLGPEDGLEIDHWSFEMVPGERVGESFPTGTNEGDVAPTAVWGSSFAYSEEIVQLGYVGYGKADANVYNGKRIVEVCFWWTRAGSAVSSSTCSDAMFNGGWVPGPEKTHTVSDSLGINDPPTIFNFDVVRIDPSAHW